MSTQDVVYSLDDSPLSGSLKDLGDITLRNVIGTREEPLWDQLVRTHHYLGFTQMVGARMKYLASAGQRVIAAIGWTGGSRKLMVRDYFIGWSEHTRRENLLSVANNNRFLVLPFVRVKNLASHILSRCTLMLIRDWYERYGQQLLLLETFIDPDRYSGCMYRAANWIYIGETKGYGKHKKGYEYHGKVKEVYLYVVEPKFRTILGCEQRPLPRVSLRKAIREGKVEMMLRFADWDSPEATRMDITYEDMEVLAEEIMKFHEEFRECFPRKETRLLGLTYLRGLTSTIQRKTAEGIALELSAPEHVRSTQCFMTSHTWDEQAMLEKHNQKLSLIVSDPIGGVVTVDSSEFLKKGDHSVGVSSQYCGRFGKVDNCQSGVFIGYASEKGYGLIDRQLYMPKVWFGDSYKEKREECRVPEKLKFQTKQEIALALIEKMLQGGLFSAQWLACDSTFGRDHEFRDAVGRWYKYFAAVSSDMQVWTELPRMGVPRWSGKGKKPQKEKVLSKKAHPVKVEELALSPRIEWQDRVLGEGAKGPIVASVGRLRVWESREGVPGPECWLFLRRYENGEIKYALSNAARETGLEEMIGVCTKRWPIEQCFQEGKSELGMTDYQHRSWPGWHRHMTYVLLGQLFLLQVRYVFKKKAPVLTLPLARKLVVAVLKQVDPLSIQQALEIVRYYIINNERARKSHQKKRVAALKARGVRLNL